MSVLSSKQRLSILAALVDGNSERAAMRMADVDRKTIGRFALRVGAAAWNLHNTQAHDLSCSLIENDEIWSYVKKKQARATPEDNAAGLGEAYTFVALAMPSRYVVTWKVGRRDEASTMSYLEDLRARLVVMPAMTSDGFAPYVNAIGKHLGPGVDYAQTIKNYTKGGRRDDDHRYEPARDPFITKKAIFGAPDIDHATTAHVERHNGTMRHHIGRMRRLCYAFSKNPAHHVAAVNLCYCHYNLCWIPRTMRVTPAYAAGATDHVWELPELLDALMSVPETPVPSRKPLAHRAPVGPARELPNGRGFLRLVSPGGGSSGPGPTSPGPASPTEPSAPAAPLPAVASSSGASAPTSAGLVPSAAPDALPGQLDLLSYRAPPPPPAPALRAPSRRLPPGQLGLFGLDFEPEPTK